MFKYLDAEISKITQKLEDFKETTYYDSGMRLSDTEAYLDGLKKAKRLINKAQKED